MSSANLHELRLESHTINAIITSLLTVWNCEEKAALFVGYPYHQKGNGMTYNG
jgi:hypothetical protein